VEILPPIPPGLHRKDMQTRLAEGIEGASQRLSAVAAGGAGADLASGEQEMAAKSARRP